MLDAGYWILDAGYWMLDTGCWMLDTSYWLRVSAIQIFKIGINLLFLKPVINNQ